MEWKKTSLSWRIWKESSKWQVSWNWLFKSTPSVTPSHTTQADTERTKWDDEKSKMKFSIWPQGKGWGSDFHTEERLTLKGKWKIRRWRKSKKWTKVGPPPFLYYEEDTFGEGPSLGSQCVDWVGGLGVYWGVQAEIEFGEMDRKVVVWSR